MVSIQTKFRLLSAKNSGNLYQVLADDTVIIKPSGSASLHIPTSINGSTAISDYPLTGPDWNMRVFEKEGQIMCGPARRACLIEREHFPICKSCRIQHVRP
jgi:hypothetical protein